MKVSHLVFSLGIFCAATIFAQSNDNITPLMMFSNEVEKPFSDPNQSDERISSPEAIREHELAGTGDSPSQISRGDLTGGVAEITTSGSDDTALNTLVMQMPQPSAQEVLATRATSSQNQQSLDGATIGISRKSLAIKTVRSYEAAEVLAEERGQGQIQWLANITEYHADRQKRRTEESDSPGCIAALEKTAKIEKFVSFDIPEPSLNKEVCSVEKKPSSQKEAVEKIKRYTRYEIISIESDINKISAEDPERSSKIADVYTEAASFFMTPGSSNEAKYFHDNYSFKPRAWSKRTTERDKNLELFSKKVAETEENIETQISSIPAEDLEQSSKIAAIYAEAYPTLQAQLNSIIIQRKRKRVMSDEKTALGIGLLLPG